MADHRFAVIGAGVVGLTSAVQLQQAFPTSQVTIIAHKFNEDTTSFGAGGLFRPAVGKTPGVPDSVLNQWLRDSWQYFKALAHSEMAGEAGCQIATGYEFYDCEQELLSEENRFAFERVHHGELSIHPNVEYSHVYRGSSILATPTRFIPFLMKQFISSGGKIQRRKLSTLEELTGMYDVVINCAGLEAREVVNDSKIYPSRGHLIKVKAPWIKTYIYAEDGHGNFCHVFPRADDVVIGGVKHVRNENLTPNSADRDAIWRRACEFFPSLKEAEVISEWVGLRPMRNPLRLEYEIMHFKKGNLKVVHNYGHGSHGIALSWGTSAHVVKIVKQLMAVSKY